MHFHLAGRALELMHRGALEERSSPRVHLSVRGSLAFADSAVTSDIALLRDVNVHGAFFYCRLKATLGQTLTLCFPLLGQGDTKVMCEGIVIRVEESSPIGVAMAFTRYEVYRDSHPERPLQQFRSTLH